MTRPEPPAFCAPIVPRLGDTLRIVAPAGPFDRLRFWRGLGWLASHFRLRLGDHVFERDGFVAGSIAARAADLRAALLCRESSAVVCARGGVGSADVASVVRHCTAIHSKWLVGFSDITALHAQLQGCGFMSIHASNVTSLAVGSRDLRERWLQHLVAPLRTHTVSLSALCPGTVRGPLVGGNLAVLHDLCAAGEWMPPPGAILFVEEIAEPPYRIYRMLRALQRRGALLQLSGIVVGQITDSHRGPHGREAREVFSRVCEECQLPAAWGLAAGHEPGTNLPLTLGGWAHLSVSANHARLELNAPYPV